MEPNYQSLSNKSGSKERYQTPSKQSINKNKGLFKKENRLYLRWKHSILKNVKLWDKSLYLLRSSKRREFRRDEIKVCIRFTVTIRDKSRNQVQSKRSSIVIWISKVFKSVKRVSMISKRRKQLLKTRSRSQRRNTKNRLKSFNKGLTN